MPSLPSRFAEVILTFAPLFLQQRTWDHAGMLLIGAILAPGQRTVTSLLRIMGLSGERRFVNYHRVGRFPHARPERHLAHLHLRFRGPAPPRPRRQGWAGLVG